MVGPGIVVVCSLCCVLCVFGFISVMSTIAYVHSIFDDFGVAIHRCGSNTNSVFLLAALNRAIIFSISINVRNNLIQIVGKNLSIRIFERIPYFFGNPAPSKRTFGNSIVRSAVWQVAPFSSNHMSCRPIESMKIPLSSSNRIWAIHTSTVSPSSFSKKYV